MYVPSARQTTEIRTLNSVVSIEVIERPRSESPVDVTNIRDEDMIAVDIYSTSLLLLLLFVLFGFWLLPVMFFEPHSVGV